MGTLRWFEKEWRKALGLIPAPRKLGIGSPDGTGLLVKELARLSFENQSLRKRVAKLEKDRAPPPHLAPAVPDKDGMVTIDGRPHLRECEMVNIDDTSTCTCGSIGEREHKYRVN